MGEIVILETERLQLRQFVPEDLEALEKVIGDPVAMQWYSAPFDREGVRGWIERNISRYQREGHGLWAMVLRTSGVLIGDCGCVLQEVEARQQVEIAYHVRRDMWGNGYAPEAARACMDYAYTRLGVKGVISMIRPENRNSIRVAEKNGLTCEKVVFWRGYDHCLYAQQKP